MRAFGKGFLIGTACICALALVWLCFVRPEITTQEAESLKAAYTTSPGANGSGAGLLPAEREDAPALDFAALRSRYPDVKAWLTIPGTPVDYPVLQSSPESPEYYLRRNYRGEWRMAGSLFFQSDCSMNGRVLIVYGHNMNNATMFGRLPRYLIASFCASHKTIRLETPDGTSEYSVAAVLETDVSRVPFNRTVFTDDTDFLAFAQNLLDGAAIKTDVTITAGSRLLILVTCSYAGPDARVVVVGVQK